MCIGIYGPSQSGKSYLVSALAREPGKRLVAMLGGREVDFIETINALLCPLNVDGTMQFPSSIFSYLLFSIDINSNGSGTGKVKIKPNGNYASYINTITLDFTRDINGNVDNIPVSSKIGWNIGFIKPRYTGSNEYTSETIIEPASIRYIYLAVDDFNNNVNDGFIGAFNSSILNKNILARITLQGGVNIVSYYNQNNLALITYARQYFGPVDIMKLQIQLLDEYGRIIDLNNMDYSMCLTFQTIYDL
jgi:hypothetical protein